MSIIVPAAAVAFAAFSVWLGVRIVNRREQRAKCAAVAAICVPLLYAASFGPACRLVASRHVYHTIVERAYWPILWAFDESPFGRIHAIQWYGGIWMPKGAHILLEFAPPDGFMPPDETGYWIPFDGR